MILILVMMLGITALITSDTQFKLAGNLQFEDIAMNSAETSVSTAEAWVRVNYDDPGFTTYDGANSPYLHPIGHLAGLTAPNNDPLTMTWTDSNSLSNGGNDTQRYIIERVSRNVRLIGSGLGTGDRSSTACNQVNTYLITARGITPVRGATKFIQSYYSVLSC
jgi:Tfp pilus assembly protein PilX